MTLEFEKKDDDLVDLASNNFLSVQIALTMIQDIWFSYQFYNSSPVPPTFPLSDLRVCFFRRITRLVVNHPLSK